MKPMRIRSWLNVGPFETPTLFSLCLNAREPSLLLMSHTRVQGRVGDWTHVMAIYSIYLLFPM